jgi:hypothetical protein
MPSQGNPLLSVRVPQALNQLLESKAEAEGLDRSKVAIAALKAYLSPPEPQDEISLLKQQMMELQRAIATIGK